MPEQEQKKLPPPEWLPEKYHNLWSKHGVQAIKNHGLSHAEILQIANTNDISPFGSDWNNVDRRNFIVNLKNLDRPSSSQVWQSEDPNILTKEQIDEILSDSYDKHFIEVVLRNRAFHSVVSPDQVNAILKSPNFSAKTKAEAFFHPNSDPNIKLADFTNGMSSGSIESMFSSGYLDFSSINDAKVAQIVNAIDSASFVDRYVTERGRSKQNSIGPLTADAILNHKNKWIRQQGYHDVPVPDSTLDKILNGMDRNLLIDNKHFKDYTPEEFREVRKQQDKSPNQYLRDGGGFSPHANNEIYQAISHNKHLNDAQKAKIVQHYIDSGLHKLPEITGEGKSSAALTAGNLLARLATPEQQRVILSNPENYPFLLHAIREKENNDSVRGIDPSVYEDVFMDHFKKSLTQDDSESFIYASSNTPKIMKQLADYAKQEYSQYGRSNIAIPDLIGHRNTSIETTRDLWDFFKNDENINKKNKHLTADFLERAKADLAAQILSTNSGDDDSSKTLLPLDFTIDLVNNVNGVNLNRLNFENGNLQHPEVRSLMFDILSQANKDGHVSKETFADYFTELAASTTSPDVLREFNQKKYTDERVAASVASGDARLLNGLVDNPHTPSDVLGDIHESLGKNFSKVLGDDEREGDLYELRRSYIKAVEHDNFPKEKLEKLALLSYDDDPNKEHDPINQAVKIAKNKVGNLDPDKYHYKNSVPGEKISDSFTGEHYVDKQGKDFGNIETKMGLSKLRLFRDKILESDPTKGEIQPKKLGPGPFNGGWKPVQEKNGNISAKKIQEFIDTQPSTRYNFAHQVWDGAQRHSSHDQRVFKLNVTTDHINKLIEAGVYPSFKALTQMSNESGHPSDSGHTLGWVRYEHHLKPPPEEGVLFPQDLQDRAEYSTVRSKPEAIHIDEIQTDLGHNTFQKLKKHPQRLKDHGINADHLDKISEILWGKHHPSEILIESFKQHQRNIGNHDVPVHMLHAKTKAPISGQSLSDELPAHMQFSYDQMPKKMGFEPAQYGETTQQNGSDLEGKPTWKDKIRKFEEELLFKALSDIKVGSRTVDYPRSKQSKLPTNLLGRTNVYDYNHILSPLLKRAKYKLYVTHYPESAIYATLFHKGNEIGAASSKINLYDPTKMRIDSVGISDSNDKPKHRGKGLGTAMYEAMFAHAVNAAGVTHVTGNSHSSMAHNVHNKLARKHGLAYKALPNYLEGTAQHWENREDWENAPSGPYDDKYGKYEYLLKNEHSPLKAAGFKHKVTGQIIETGPHHDMNFLPEGEDTDLSQWEDGFVDHKGTFLNRMQAAQLVNMAKESHHRDWLDSYDAEAGIEKNEDGLMAMLEQDNPVERIMALKSHQVQPHHILIAINDTDPSVRQFAASHPNINGPLLLECLRQAKSPDSFNLLLNHESCGDEHINYAMETDWGGNGGPESIEDEELC
jgi:hypothetical protein